MNQSKPMLKAPEFLLFGFFDLKPFSHQSMISTLSFCAEPKAKSQNLPQQLLDLKLPGQVLLQQIDISLQ
jgi:hypothetical protein